MIRTTTTTSLILAAVLLGGCTNGIGSGQGGAAPGATSAHADDGDGVPADQDLCPGTAAGAAVDGNGCSAEQRQAQQKPTLNGGAASGGAPGTTAGSSGGSAQTGSDGQVAPNGFAKFVLDPKGPVPVTLETLAQNVKKTDHGFDLEGTVLIEVPGNQHVTLTDANVKLEYDSTKGEGLQSFSGTAELPFPDIGFMQGVHVDDPVYASVGYDLGKNIQNVNAPIEKDRKYFYFTFSAGLSAQIGKLDVGTPVNQSVTMTLDPSDPSFFMRASLGGLMGPVEDASVGFSIGGHLPFTPENTWGIDATKATFDGHMWIGGKVSLQDLELPLAVGGNTVIDLDPDNDGKTVFQDPAQGFTFGSNSELDVSFDAGVLSLEIPVSKATTVGHVDSSGAWAMYSGHTHAGDDWLPADYVPIKNPADLLVAGYASTNVTDSYYKAEGDMKLDAGTLGKWTGLNLDDLAMAQATLDIDQNGVKVTGKASTSISPVIGLNGDIDAVGFFNGDPAGWYVTLDGRLAVKGIDLSSSAHAKLDKNGFVVSGKMQTPVSLIAMSGSINSSGIDLEGNANVTIPIEAGKQVVQTVTDAAICGTQYVTDGAICGYQTVTDGAKCGYTAVTSAAQCGYTTVTSAAECGYKTVTSGAICGYHTVTDIIQCGIDILGGAKSCKVANTCKTAASCQVAATCNVAKTCSVANSCQIAKTCNQTVTIPNYNYGTFTGSVDVKIGDSGLDGTVSGQYCPASGSCTTLGSGYVKVTSGTPEACVSVSGLGDFCAQF